MDKAKYFHWDKTSLRNECCKLADQVAELERDVTELQLQNAALRAELDEYEATHE